MKHKRAHWHRRLTEDEKFYVLREDEGEERERKRRMKLQ